MSKLLCSASLAALCFVSSPAFADDSATTPTSGSIYKLEDFSQFSPRTAMDLVRNIPGFSIVEPDEKRGLGQGGGNVLINGKRPSTKSQNLHQILGQISSSNVTQITVQDASKFDIPGLSGEVANIETDVKGFSGNWRWDPVVREHRSAWLANGDLSFSGQKGFFDYAVTLKNRVRRNQARGPEIVWDGNGVQTQLRNEYIHFTRDNPSISTRIGYEGPSGDIANLNFNFDDIEWSFTEWSDRDRFFEPDEFRHFEEGSDIWEAEINGDYEFNLGPGRLKFIGLYSKDFRAYFNEVDFLLNDVEFERGFRFQQDAYSSEAILRGEYSWKTDGDKDWQIAAEAAFNSLEEEGILFQQAAGTLRYDRLPSTASLGIVEEDRAEITLTHGRPLSSKLSIQASLGAEFSKIQSKEFEVDVLAASKQDEFFRPKGFVNLSYAHSNDLTFSTKIEREVGQLDFGDFLGQPDLADGLHSDSNLSLVPEQTWLLEFDLTKQHGAWGSSSLKLAAKQIEDLQDRTITITGGEAPGNLEETATAFEAIWSGTFNFDPIGAKGLKLDYTLEAFDSNLTDPLTGEERRFSDETMTYIELNMRYDIPETNWALSAYMETERVSLNPSSRQVIRVYRDDPFFGFTIEHKDIFGMKARLGARNIGNQDESIYKQIFVDRRDGPVDFTEFRRRKYDPFFVFSLSGTF